MLEEDCNKVVGSQKTSEGRLYYNCENDACDFQAWCNLISFSEGYGTPQIDERPRMEEGDNILAGRLTRVERNDDDDDEGGCSYGLYLHYSVFIGEMSLCNFDFMFLGANLTVFLAITGFCNEWFGHGM